MSVYFGLIEDPVMDPQDIRTTLLHKAHQAVALGSHYLTQTFGAIPGGVDPIKGRYLEWVNVISSFPNLTLRTAEYRHKRCLGRWQTACGAGGQVDTEELARLRTWFDGNRAIPAADWPAYQGRCFPRRERLGEGPYYLGEDCADRLHFDCDGLISWLFSSAMGFRVDYSVVQWQNKGVRRAPVLTELRPCDVLTRTSSPIPHIAIVIDPPSRMIHASWAGVGVVEADIPRDFTGWYRPTDRFLLGVGEPQVPMAWQVAAAATPE